MEPKLWWRMPVDKQRRYKGSFLYQWLLLRTSPCLRMQAAPLSLLSKPYCCLIYPRTTAISPLISFLCRFVCGIQSISFEVYIERNHYPIQYTPLGLGSQFVSLRLVFSFTRHVPCLLSCARPRCIDIIKLMENPVCPFETSFCVD